MEIKFCPTCQKDVETTCCACGCGNCKVCNYRWSCMPPHEPVMFEMDIDSIYKGLGITMKNCKKCNQPCLSNYCTECANEMTFGNVMFITKENQKSMYEYIQKPWGFERILHRANNYVVKELFFKKGEQCSLQYHNEKDEQLYVVSGAIEVEQVDTEGNKYFYIMHPGTWLHIPPKQIHRTKGLMDSIVLETSTDHLQDLVRLEDDYGRI